MWLSSRRTGVLSVEILFSQGKVYREAVFLLVRLAIIGEKNANAFGHTKQLGSEGSETELTAKVLRTAGSIHVCSRSLLKTILM